MIGVEPSANGFSLTKSNNITSVRVNWASNYCSKYGGYFRVLVEMRSVTDPQIIILAQVGKALYFKPFRRFSWE